MVIESFTMTGVKQINTQMESLRRSKDFRPFWNIAKSIVWRSTAKRFREGGGSRGMWAPLSDATPQLRKFGRVAKPLQDQGMLMKSVTTKESVKKDTSTELIIGTNLRYAKLQQDGFTQPVTPRMKGFFIYNGVIPGPAIDAMLEVPGRPYLYLDEQDKKDLQEGLEYYYKKIIESGKVVVGGGGLGFTSE